MRVAGSEACGMALQVEAAEAEAEAARRDAASAAAAARREAAEAAAAVREAVERDDSRGALGCAGARGCRRRSAGQPARRIPGHHSTSGSIAA